jgi:hypothetical protein
MAAPTIERALKLRLAEGQTLDLKSDLYTESKDWLKDVTSFANTDGGTILIGVTEDDDGRASEGVGLSGALDQEIQRLSAWLREHSEPDVSGAVRISTEEDAEGRRFLIVDIEESSRGPHRVSMKSEKAQRQVYIRQGRDSVPADMDQIRDLIVGAHRTPARIEAFVTDRVSRLAGSNPLRNTLLQEYMSVHLCPRRGFGDRKLVDWVLDHPTVPLGDLELPWSSVRPNASGAYAAVTDEGAEAYHHVFYNGAAELTYTNVLFEPGEMGGRGSGAVVPATRLKNWVERQGGTMLSIMHQATGCSQFEVFVTFGGLADYRLVWRQRNDSFPGQSRGTPDQDLFTLPSTLVRIGGDGRPVPDDLKAVNDMIWRAWGEMRCLL